MGTRESEITSLLAGCADGDRQAIDRLFSLVYQDLRTIAHRHLRGERDGHTLDTTCLVHEAYLELAAGAEIEWRNRAHFFALVSRAMRHILIDYARARRTEKRGGATIRVPLREDLAGDAPEAPSTDLLALDAALTELSRYDERMARIVECRFFGGMSVEETAEALGVGVRTVERDWTRAKAYLYRQLAE